MWKQARETTISSLPFDSQASHGSASDELEELAAAFALEALASEERADYAAHVSRCGVCQRLAGEFQTVAELLPEILDEEPVLASLKSRIQSEARRDLGAMPQNPSAREEARPGVWGWTSWLSKRPAWAIAVIVPVLIGLVAWNVILQLALNQRPETTPEQQALLDALASGAAVIALAGTEAAPASSARIIQVPGSDRAFLLVSDLGPPPANHVYQVWRIEEDTPEGVGTFNIVDSRAQIVSLRANFSDADAIGVSIEPKGGSAAPTGDIVLLGTP